MTRRKSNVGLRYHALPYRRGGDVSANDPMCHPDATVVTRSCSHERAVKEQMTAVLHITDLENDSKRRRR